MSEEKKLAARARELLAYDPETGIVRWKKHRWKTKVGCLAGTEDHYGYIVVYIDGRQYRMHRIVFLMVEDRWPNGEIDHINGLRYDNRWCNLREVSVKENRANRHFRDKTSHLPKGVGIGAGKYIAVFKGKNIGEFDTLSTAHVAWCRAALEHDPVFSNDGGTGVLDILRKGF